MERNVEEENFRMTIAVNGWGWMPFLSPYPHRYSSTLGDVARNFSKGTDFLIKFQSRRRGWGLLGPLHGNFIDFS